MHRLFQQILYETAIFVGYVITEPLNLLLLDRARFSQTIFGFLISKITESSAANQSLILDRRPDDSRVRQFSSRQVVPALQILDQNYPDPIRQKREIAFDFEGQAI